LKEDDRYKHIPVIIIFISSHQQKTDMAARLVTLCYFTDPNAFEELKAVLEVISKT